MRTNRITSMSTLPLFSLTQSRREDTSVNTGSVKVLLPKCRQFEGQANGFSRVSRLVPSAQIVIGHSFLYLIVCRNGSIDRERNEGGMAECASGSGHCDCVGLGLAGDGRTSSTAAAQTG
jgi:hypothetical protein